MKLGEVIVFTPFGPKPPGDSNAHVFQSDRGSRKGDYMLAWTGSSKDKRPDDVPGSTAEASEYQLLSPDKVGPLPDVDVLGIHYIKVRPDRRDAFEKYVGDTLHPAVGNLRPDLRLLYYKAVRGPDTGNYITIFALTKESRDKVLARRIRFRRSPGGVQTGQGAHEGAADLSRRRLRADG